MQVQEFRHFLVERSDDGQLRHGVTTTTLDAQPAGDVVIRVAWSSVNYKDALAMQGHPGVAGELPHVPGIDAAGTVVASEDPRYSVGESVLVTGYELGAPRWGGWSEYIRVPADWAVPLPRGMTKREAMVVGTAGFTAAQCLEAIQSAGVSPDDGPVVVTGATGGVGSFAVRLLSQKGYEVHAVTGKSHTSERLRNLGAFAVHGRDVLADNPKRPLLGSKWAGGIDTVGGTLLVALLKSTQIGGCVSACGLVAGDQLPMTVYPFILRGVTLAGVTSASCSRAVRERLWKLLSGDWKIDYPDSWVEEATLDELPQAVKRINAGEVTGRIVVNVASHSLPEDRRSQNPSQ